MLIVCAVMLVIGCIGANAETTGRPRSDYIGSVYNEGYTHAEIYFYHDDIRRVSCWISVTKRISGGGAGTGISCIPDSQLGLHNIVNN